MDQPMGYIILLAIAAVPTGLFGMFLLAIATGVIHEPTAIETVAHNYGLSWKTGRHEV
ncbi:MAG: hypothetical protein H6841_10740 [Planctomycetes bacterium]|nr:hypothetical protein [Planctomycetota bacterium]MCB9936283.1 hypothetical protein [Planctomycetota bacterium]